MLKSWKPNLKQFVVTNMAVPVLVNQNVDLKSSFPTCFESKYKSLLIKLNVCRRFYCIYI